MDVFPVSEAERLGLELQRVKLRALGYTNDKTRTDVTWTFHGGKLHSVLASQRTLVECEQ